MTKRTALWADRKHLKLLKNSLKNDKISITSTDTILGFLGNLSLKSFNLLTSLKKERENKPFLILISSKLKLSHFVNSVFLNNSKNLLNLIDHFWPGPLTIIFKAKKDLPSFLTSKEGTIALRCPKHDGLQTLLKDFTGLFSTSANQTGKQPPIIIKQIDTEILKNIEYLIVDKVMLDSNVVIKQTLPSTIIDVSNEKSVRVVRVGALPIKELEKYYGSKIKEYGRIL